jgi:hypothetical protein
MTELAYLALVFAATVAAAFLGAAAHFWRAHAKIIPEDLGLGETLNTLTRDDYQFEKHVVGAEWDDNGYWDGGSARNLVYYILSSAAAVVIAGAIGWGYRENIVAGFCKAFAHIGLSPPICF